MSSLFIESYCKAMSKHTDAAPICHKAVAYTVIGSLLTRERYRAIMTFGSPPTWTNLWTLIVGDSGTGHKSTAVDFGKVILGELSPKETYEKEIKSKNEDANPKKVSRSLRGIVAPNEMSPEGFLTYLQTRSEHSVDKASTILVQSEFLNLMMQFERSYAQSLKPILLELFDVPTIPYARELKKESVEIEKPRVSILGAIATELLASHAESDDWTGGFFSRFLIVTGKKQRTQELLPEIPPSTVERYVETLGKGMCLREDAVKRNGATIDFDKHAREMMTRIPKESDEEQLRSVLSRASTHLLKIAAVEQFDEDPASTMVKGPAMERALHFVMDQWLPNVPNIIEECFTRNRKDLEGDRLAKRMRRYLERRGGELSKRETMRQLCINLREFNGAVDSLEAAGSIKRFTKTEGGGTWLKLIPREEVIAEDNK